MQTLNCLFRGQCNACFVKTHLEFLETLFHRYLLLGLHLSMTERRADDASRDVEQWLKCEYMREKVGENFHGVISGVAGFGLFVELSEVFVEGMISIRDLKDDYFIFDDVHHQLKGQNSGKIYRLGDMIKVKVASVNLDDRKIDFIPSVSSQKNPRKKRN